jgi:hypothetical protein
MVRLHRLALGVVVVLGNVLVSSARAEDSAAASLVDKGIKALGGEDALAKAKAASWKSKGTLTINGDENPISSQSTAQGLDHYRSDFEGQFNGEKVQGVVILNGDKGWRKFRDDSRELDGEAVGQEKRNVYLQLVPATLMPLKGKDFKIQAAGEEKVGEKVTNRLKVTGPDGKEFTLFLDKESGLPVKLVAQVIGFGGDEFAQETTFAEYKDFGGIKKATKIESKRDGERFLNIEITEFKVLDQVPADTFAEPK